MNSNFRLSIFLIVTLATIFSCKDSTTTPAAKADMTMKEEKSSIKVSDFSSSPLFNDAKLSNMEYSKGKFSFDVAGDTYSLGQQTTDAPKKMCANSGKGQHIHLIVDDLPYSAQYVSDFEHDVADGEHHILAFLSRSYHESIKQPNASIVQKVTVKDKTITAAADVKDPMVFYSRPKGTYIGKDTEKVMLDYFIANRKQGQYVTANINGTDMDFREWKPYFLEGLPMGENTITLTLKDSSGKKVAAPNNPVSRTFTLKADPEAKM